MQEQHMNWIVDSKLFEEMIRDRPQKDISDMFYLKAEQVKKETTNLPENMRTPTVDELTNMELYSREYRKKKPNASNREVKRAIQRKFNIQLLPDTIV